MILRCVYGRVNTYVYVAMVWLGVEGVLTGAADGMSYCMTSKGTRDEGDQNTIKRSIGAIETTISPPKKQKGQPKLPFLS